MTAAMPASFGILCLIIFIIGCCTSWHNKMAYHKLMNGRTIGEVEHILTEKIMLYSICQSTDSNSVSMPISWQHIRLPNSFMLPTM